jgi:SAM-dependent methyltransferase
MKQREIFLASEGDAWYRRNREYLERRELPGSDPLLTALLALPEEQRRPGARVLEIGCGDGTRLAWLRAQAGFECFGLDPSADAVAASEARGVRAAQGTADLLPFENGSFDFVLFGFCLYLCDREDLFRVAAEADRVLRDPGWLLLLDFYSPVPLKREYHHSPGLFSYKMDYRALFSWHPGYVVYAHDVRHHVTHGFTDDANEWIATSVLRKNLKAC